MPSTDLIYQNQTLLLKTHPTQFGTSEQKKRGNCRVGKKIPMGHSSINKQIYKTCKYGVPGRFPREPARRLHEYHKWVHIQESLTNAPSPET